MKSFIWSNLSRDERRDILSRPACATDSQINDIVADIVQDVRGNGDIALRRYTKKFDGADLDAIAVSNEVIEGAKDVIAEDAKIAIQTAYANIYTFHECQGAKPYDIETMPGVMCRREIRPIERVGLYVPGGSAPLISTTLMIGIPAQLAGCSQRILCTPCDADGEIDPHILFAAELCGIDKIYRVGGAQAIAAMAYGTETIPKVDKIFGPGNAYVTAAKSLVSTDNEGAALDMPAGPSEVCVIVSDDTNPAYAAFDLLSQAEHDPLSQVLLIATNENKADEVMAETQKQLTDLPRKEIAGAALENSRCIIVSNLDEAIEVSNEYAPEHLILCFDDADRYCANVTKAGSVFVGQYTPESVGDYASGTNHVLPTYGYARTYAGLSVEAFQRTMTVQTLTPQGLENIGNCVEKLAELEGLDAHKRAVSVRRAS